MGVQAHHVAGGTALEINNGSVRVGGTVRAAFVVTVPANGSCVTPSHPLLDNDPTAILFVTPLTLSGWGAAHYSLVEPGRWSICKANPLISSPSPMAVLVIKQG